MILASAQVEEVLLGFRIVFLVVLYLFIWRVVRAVARDPGGRQAAVTAREGSRSQDGKLVVVSSPVLRIGAERLLDGAAVTIGRIEDNDFALLGDEYASARHARFEQRRDGVYVEDVGSTNGTFVNGSRIVGPQRLEPGDLVRVGETDLRYDR